ncbi:hypothetical protein, partial [Polynucleobacter sp. IMCC 29146]|uniref:hypothetical protein n=1 Tax=Polynucleobacter sp. IMCC 29146 TaxID=2780953 RepID=UPI001F21951C
CACLRMAMIWLSVKREFFIEFPFKSNNLEILLLTQIKGWGDYHPKLTHFAALIYYRKTLFGSGPKLTAVHPRLCDSCCDATCFNS